MCAFEEMMRKQIVMPAHLMDDLQHKGKTGRSLFADFSSVAQVLMATSFRLCCTQVPSMQYLLMNSSLLYKDSIVYVVSCM